MAAFEIIFLRALVFTIIFEMAAIFAAGAFLLKGSQWPGSVRLSFAGVLATFATLPYLWFVFPYFLKPGWEYTIACELFAVLTEGVIYLFLLEIGFKKALALSFACNAISFMAGLWLFGLFL